MVFVDDEYGTVIGIVTLENILELIVGRVEDEFDSEPLEITPGGERQYYVLGSTPVEVVEEQLGLELAADVFFGITSDPEGNRLGPERPHLGGLGVAVGVADFSWPQRFFDRNQFIPRGQHPDPRPAHDPQSIEPQRGQHPEFLRPHQVAGFQHPLPGFDIFPCMADVVAGRHRPFDGDRGAATARPPPKTALMRENCRPPSRRTRPLS